MLPLEKLIDKPYGYATAYQRTSGPRGPSGTGPPVLLASGHDLRLGLGLVFGRITLWNTPVRLATGRLLPAGGLILAGGQNFENGKNNI